MSSVNKLKSVAKAFGDVPASLTTLLDLGTVYSYNTLMIMNGLDAAIVLKIGSNEINFPANKDVVIEDIVINDVIQYKYSSAPSSGSLTVICA